MHRLSVLLMMTAVAGLLALGIVMLASTGEFAQDAHGRPYFFLKHQLMWLGLGILGCAVMANIDYRQLVKRWVWVYVISAVLLICCFAPGIGAKINGSHRWIRLGFATFQPSELAKAASILALAWWLSQERDLEKQFLRGFVLPLLVVGGLMGLIVCEVDVGSTVLIGGTAMCMLFVSGSPWKFIGGLMTLGVLAVAGAISMMPERLGRFLAFMNPEKYPADAYQTQQGLIALGSGGMSGLGLGNGRQKLLYLPYAHTDFIFPMVGEELGLVGTLGVIMAYILFMLGGVSIAMKARDRAGLLTGMGIVMLISLQALVNLGVTTELLPNKGLPLPFISYGGSNLAFCLLGVGVLINIYRQGVSEREEEQMQQLEMALQAEKRVVRL
jgi:cell division protein FtsW